MTEPQFISIRSNAKDRTGSVFGKLTVEGPVARGGNGDLIWRASCECGGHIDDRYANLRHYTGCGCNQVMSGERSLSHGHARGAQGTPTYQTWLAMRRRCLNPKSDNWHKYGAIGVTVCEAWADSFEAFLADMGERPAGTTIDRYPDPAGNYEPGNCRWATPTQQRHNRRD